MNEAATHGVPVWGAASGKYIDELKRKYKFYVDYLGSSTGQGKATSIASKLLEERLQASL